jgi:protein-S-isoprenylcysteine O-methyltransferase Ste14
VENMHKPVTDSLQKRRFPRWSGAILLLIGFPAAHVVAPWLLSRLSVHHGWQAQRPGFWNLIGLLPLATGTSLAAYSLAAHVSSWPRRFEFRKIPDYLLTTGPYRFSRNPLYIAEGLMWLGWGAFYGSAWVWGVVTGMIVFSKFLVRTIVRREERDLEARFGEEYRAYANSVPRWI